MEVKREVKPNGQSSWIEKEEALMASGCSADFCMGAGDVVCAFGGQATENETPV